MDKIENYGKIIYYEEQRSQFSIGSRGQPAVVRRPLQECRLNLEPQDPLQDSLQLTDSLFAVPNRATLD